MYIGVIIRNIIISYYYLLLLSQVYNHKYELDMGNNVDQTIQIKYNDKMYLQALSNKQKIVCFGEQTKIN